MNKIIVSSIAGFALTASAMASSQSPSNSDKLSDKNSPTKSDQNNQKLKSALGKKALKQSQQAPVFLRQQFYHLATAKMIMAEDSLNFPYNPALLRKAAQLIIEEASSKAYRLKDIDVRWLMDLKYSLPSMDIDNGESFTYGDILKAVSFWEAALLGRRIEEEIIAGNDEIRSVIRGEHYLDAAQADTRLATLQNHAGRLAQRLTALRQRIKTLSASLESETRRGASPLRLQSFKEEITTASAQLAKVSGFYRTKVTELENYAANNHSVSAQQVAAATIIKRALMQDSKLFTIMDKTQEKSLLALKRKYPNIFTTL